METARNLQFLGLCGRDNIISYSHMHWSIQVVLHIITAKWVYIGTCGTVVKISDRCSAAIRRKFSYLETLPSSNK